MKKITLFAIISFVITVSSIFALSKFIITDGVEVKVSRTSQAIKVEPSKNIVLPKPKPINNTKTVTSDTEGFKKIKVKPNKPEHLNSPNIDIAILRDSIILQKSASSFSMSDMSKHSTPQDCYLVINGNVYNITPYIPYHPAGSRIIERYCGQEVTGIFANIHSNRAWDLLKNYKIGSMDRNTYNIMSDVLSSVAKSLQENNPSAIVMEVITPRHGIYIAKVIFDNKFYEVHIDESGKIVNEEIAGNENWNKWEVDLDDN